MPNNSKILIVEDEAIVARDIQNCLTGLGYEVVDICASGEKAITVASKKKPDLVLMDITLKGKMDGVEAAAIIRTKSDIPVVYLTAHADEHTLSRAKTTQAYGFIIKPFEERDVRTAVEIALYKHKTELKLSAYNEARKLAELQAEEAKTANRLKDEFLATLSHELRTPLNAIVGYTDLLKSKSFETEEESDLAIAAIDRNSRSLRHLVEDLLDTSRIITGKFQLNCTAVNISELSRQAIESLNLAARAKQITVTLLTEGVVRPIFGDPERIQQVVWNLLSNAIKFTPKGGRIDVIVRDPHSHVEFSIRDTGEGIEPEFLPSLFDRFRQENGTIRRSHGGLGLGLAIARHIVELHGGDIEATSRGKGKGSTFSFRIPILAVLDNNPEREGEEDQHEETAAGAETAAKEAALLANLHIAIIEDAADSRMLISKILQAHGAKVIAISSAKDALQRLRHIRPHVVLCDIGMPEMDGYTFMDAFRAQAKKRAEQIPVAALTAYVGEENRKRALDHGFVDHIPKPVDAHLLVHTIARLVQRAPCA